uniref:Uncharacterized protein n=1 Tax=Physcomitrium patens TaxID=3218 RepID=A0A2K1K8A1_PHYPA|nr:hypothetical protein PHYPA_011897 [Physcomitrium patens]
MNSVPPHTCTHTHSDSHHFLLLLLLLRHLHRRRLLLLLFCVKDVGDQLFCGNLYVDNTHGPSFVFCFFVTLCVVVALLAILYCHVSYVYCLSLCCCLRVHLPSPDVCVCVCVRACVRVCIMNLCGCLFNGLCDYIEKLIQVGQCVLMGFPHHLRQVYGFV